MINGLMAEVLNANPEYSQEEYWNSVLGLAYNSLTDTNTLDCLYEYYKTHNESVLNDEAERIILRMWGLI